MKKCNKNIWIKSEDKTENFQLFVDMRTLQL